MNYIFKKIIQTIVHTLFQSGKVRLSIREFAKKIKNQEILEIGAGKNSVKSLFDKSNNFIVSDKNPQIPGFLKIDVNKMKFKNRFNLIVCINVLDDIFDYQKAVDNIFVAMKKNGVCYIVVNGFYPLHDLPNDYWRFTENSLKKIFTMFHKIDIKKIGFNYFPSYYIVIAKK